MGNQLHQEGNLEGALRAYDGCLKLNPILCEAVYNLGVTWMRLGDDRQALSHFLRAIEMRPGYAEAWGNAGLVFHRTGQLESAEANYRQAIRVKPAFAEVRSNLGLLLLESDRPGEAIVEYEAATRSGQQPDPNLAAAYLRSRNPDPNQSDAQSALEQSDRLLSATPGSAIAWNNHGVALQALGRPGDARRSFLNALAIDPEMPDAHFNLATVELLFGHYSRGWKEFEWRHRLAKAKPRFTDSARWRGESMEGRILLVHGEQGLGDTIQFARFLLDLGPSCSNVRFECHREFGHLFADLIPPAHLVLRGAPLPVFDRHVPLMSLPFVLGIKEPDLAVHVPYVWANAFRREQWIRALASLPRPRVGLVWAGNPKQANDHNRSAHFREFRPLLDDRRVQFVGLQVGDAARQASGLGEPNFTDLSGQLRDFEDTAAAIECLDLVITVDTAVAHLAGAMGRPVWSLLCFAADWRWQRERSDSPWYPSMRLFRQPSPQNWSAMIREVAEAIETTAPWNSA